MCSKVPRSERCAVDGVPSKNKVSVPPVSWSVFTVRHSRSNPFPCFVPRSSPLTDAVVERSQIRIVAVAAKWPMLLLSSKGSFVGWWLFSFFKLFYGCFLCTNSYEESILLIGVRDVTQPKLGFTAPPSEPEGTRLEVAAGFGFLFPLGRSVEEGRELRRPTWSEEVVGAPETSVWGRWSPRRLPCPPWSQPRCL